MFLFIHNQLNSHVTLPKKMFQWGIRHFANKKRLLRLFNIYGWRTNMILWFVFFFCLFVKTQTFDRCKETSLLKNNIFTYTVRLAFPLCWWTLPLIIYIIDHILLQKDWDYLLYSVMLLTCCQLTWLIVRCSTFKVFVFWNVLLA